MPRAARQRRRAVRTGARPVPRSQRPGNGEDSRHSQPPQRGATRCPPGTAGGPHRIATGPPVAASRKRRRLTSFPAASARRHALPARDGGRSAPERDRSPGRSAPETERTHDIPSRLSEVPRAARQRWRPVPTGARPVPRPQRPGNGEDSRVSQSPQRGATRCPPGTAGGPHRSATGPPAAAPRKGRALTTFPAASARCYALPAGDSGHHQRLLRGGLCQPHLVSVKGPRGNRPLILRASSSLSRRSLG